MTEQTDYVRPEVLVVTQSATDHLSSNSRVTSAGKHWMSKRARLEEDGGDFPTNRRADRQDARHAGSWWARGSAAAILLLTFAGEMGVAALPPLPPVSGTVWAAEGAAAGIGEPAPNFALPSATGGEVSLAAFRGKKAVVLVFYMGHR